MHGQVAIGRDRDRGPGTLPGGGIIHIPSSAWVNSCGVLLVLSFPPVPLRAPPQSPVLRIPSTRRPRHNALLTGIHYTSTPETLGRKHRPPELKGPVDDDREDDDVFMMTEEEESRNTPRWPSRANILRAIDKFVRGASPGDALVLYCEPPRRLAPRWPYSLDAGHAGQRVATDDPNGTDGLDERAYVVQAFRGGEEACAVGRFRPVPGVAQLPRITLTRAITITRPVVSLKFFTAKKSPKAPDVAPVLILRLLRGSHYDAYARSNGPLVV
ncbi:hypothetical protein BJV78DRAFT_1286217 [Lactifluus subvellereus]|nr:hypothetical protein BJV78DRAFT_1286217 [Lactifluus subvellereus]